MSNDKEKTLYLVDGSSYLFRAYHATGDLRNSKGEHTGAAYTFTNMIQSLLDEEDPAYIAVVFDPEGDTFRKEMFDQYKENRDETPEELKEQIPKVFRIVDALGIPRVSVDNYEADDVAATYTTMAREEDWSVVLVSSDKDLTQLLDDSVIMYDTMRDKKRDIDYLQNRYGVSEPDQMVDYLAMVGDSSDNIPGISGIGKKSAQTLLQQFSSMEEALENPEEISSTRIQNAIKDADRDASLYKDLIRLRTDAPVEQDLEDLKMKQPNLQELRELYRSLEFHSLLEDLPVKKTLDPGQYNLITDEELFSTLMDQIREQGKVTFDLETDGLRSREDEIVGIGFALEEEAYYVPFGHSGEDASEQLSRERVLEASASILEDPEVEKWGQNLKFDAGFLLDDGIRLRGISCDTMVASYLLNPSRNEHNLTALANRFLKHSMTPYEEVTEGCEHFGEVPLEKASRYACEDVVATREVGACLLPRLEEEELLELFEELELPLISILTRMERYGIRLDREALKEMREDLNRRMEDLEAEVWEKAGTEFNLNSPQQLQEVLFEKLDLEPVRETKTGYSTDQETLEELSSEHPVPELVLDYRKLAKLMNTYAEALPELLNEETGRLHTNFSQTRTSTGRLSSEEPNLQNIPVRTEEGRRIRRAFVAEEGWKLVSADYSQVELRVLAHITEDEALMQAFQEGEDIHTRTAAEMFEMDERMVSSDMRESAKTINYGIVYGISAYGLARRMDIDRERAEEYIERYLNQYPKVDDYMDNVVEEARETGYVRTLMGRKRYIDGLNSRNWNRRNFARRAAINTPVQGTAADLMKQAMIDVDAWLKDNDVRSRMLLQIHDELLLEVPEEEIDEIPGAVSREMEKAMDLRVPLDVDVGIGTNWAELK